MNDINDIKCDRCGQPADFVYGEGGNCPECGDDLCISCAVDWHDDDGICDKCFNANWENNEIQRPEVRLTERAASSEADAMPKKIAEAEAAQEQMKRVNTILRKYRKCPDAAIPVLIAELGMSDKGAREISTPDRFGDVGYARYMLTNNNANIRRMKERLVELQRKEAASGQETKSLDFSGGKIELDFQEDRIRILYPGKPDAATISNLKRSGFRWSRTQRGWQRPLTTNAIHDMAAIADMDAKTLLDLYHESGR